MLKATISPFRNNFYYQQMKAGGGAVSQLPLWREHMLPFLSGAHD